MNKWFVRRKKYDDMVRSQGYYRGMSAVQRKQMDKAASVLEEFQKKYPDKEEELWEVFKALGCIRLRKPPRFKPRSY